MTDSHSGTGGAGFVKNRKETRNDPRSRRHVLGEVLDNSVEPVIVEFVLVKEEQHEEASQRLLIQHLFAVADLDLTHTWLQPSLAGVEVVIVPQTTQVMMVSVSYVVRVQIEYGVTVCRELPRRLLQVTGSRVAAGLLENPLQDRVSLFEDLSPPRLSLLPQSASLRGYVLREVRDDRVVHVGQDGPAQFGGKVVEEGGVVNGRGSRGSARLPLLLLLSGLLSSLLLQELYTKEEKAET